MFMFVLMFVLCVSFHCLYHFMFKCCTMYCVYFQYKLSCSCVKFLSFHLNYACKDCFKCFKVNTIAILCQNWHSGTAILDWSTVVPCAQMCTVMAQARPCHNRARPCHLMHLIKPQKRHGHANFEHGHATWCAYIRKKLFFTLRTMHSLSVGEGN